jgi:hypothetical protein
MLPLRKQSSKTPRKRSYFKRGNKLSAEDRKYCRCVYHVAAKQSEACLRSRRWQTQVKGRNCYNPYSVCTASTKRRGSVKCFENTNLKNMPRKELKALGVLKRITPAQMIAKQKQSKPL